MENFKKKVQYEWKKYRLLLRSVPGTVMALFVLSCVLMNLLANKEVRLNLPYLALDCGLFVSWLSFLTMDMLTKRFGPKAAIQLSVTASAINLLACAILFVISRIPGAWAEYYTYGDEIVNMALNSTMGGTWYVVLGSTCAFIVSAVVNALVNAGIGKALKSDSFKSYAIRSYASTLIGQFVDNMTFALIVSHTFFSWSLIQCVVCSTTGCVVELLCEIIFSPVGYAVNKSWEKNGVGAEYLNT